MYNFIVILILIVSVLLAIVVLVQNSKGGGLAANFSAPNQIMGVRKTADFLEKATWVLAIVLVVLSLVATMSIHSGSSSKGTKNVVNAAQTTPSASDAASLPANTATPEGQPAE